MKLPECGDIEQSVEYFTRFSPAKASVILDVGTRFGSFLARLTRLGYTSVFGIDTDEATIRQGIDAYPQLRGRLRPYDGFRIPFGRGAFDIITMFDVLEHIPRVGDYLKAVYRILKPGGMLIFQTPNRYTNVPWEIVTHRSLTHWRSFHCSLQSLGSLRCVIRSAGFENLSIERSMAPSKFKAALAREKLGPAGPWLFRTAASMPLALCPNFWGYCIKPARDVEQAADSSATPPACALPSAASHAPSQEILITGSSSMTSRASSDPLKVTDHDDMRYVRPGESMFDQDRFAACLQASDSYNKGPASRQEYIDSQVPRLFRVFSLLSAFQRNLRGPTLDVASGWGILYPAFRRFLNNALPYCIAEMTGWEVTIDGENIQGCRFECEKDVLEYSDETFGLVCFFDCLEHLIVDPMWTLLELSRVLRTGGHIAISTPNIVSATRISDILQGRNPATEAQIKPTSIYQRHNREWTPLEIKHALGCAGFGQFYYSTGTDLLGDMEMELLKNANERGLLAKPFCYHGPEIFLFATKVRHVTLYSGISMDDRWPEWLYTAFDAYRKRPKKFPIVVSDDYA